MRYRVFTPLICLLASLLSTPAAAIDFDIAVRTPNVSVYIGDRNKDGRYWDGSRWRDQNWWYDNCHRFEGRRDFRGRCEPRPGRGNSEHFCPPGQAKKGRC